MALGSYPFFLCTAGLRISGHFSHFSASPATDLLNLRAPLVQLGVLGGEVLLLSVNDRLQVEQYLHVDLGQLRG